MKISIITPTKNSEKYILETLQSIHGQNYPDLEHIIVDGCSTDRTVEIIEKFIKDKGCANISLIVKPDKNMYEAINTGLSQITGDIFAYLNSDDNYYKGTFDKIEGCFKSHPGIDMIYGNCEYIDEEGKTLFWSNNPAFNFNRLIRAGTSWIQQPGTFYRKSLLKKTGYFNTSYRYASDYDYLLRVGKASRVLGIRDTLVKFRFHSGSISMSCTDVMFSERDRIREPYMRGWPVLLNKLQALFDYSVVYALLIRPENFRYMVKKIAGLLKITSR